jgi:hypothetical protein
VLVNFENLLFFPAAHLPFTPPTLSIYHERDTRRREIQSGRREGKRARTRERGREGWREGGREGGKEEWREGAKERRREGREGAAEVLAETKRKRDAGNRDRSNGERV